MDERVCSGRNDSRHVEAALAVVRKASAYRMIETGELHRALGLSAVLPSEIEECRSALDDALAEYEAVAKEARRDG